MFCVVYVFKVKPGMEKEFERTWALVTKAFYEVAGSLGSRLHKDTEQDVYVAYAQWPSKEQAAMDHLSQFSSAQQAAFTEMRACLDSVEVPYQLGVVDDLLRELVTGL